MPYRKIGFFILALSVQAAVAADITAVTTDGRKVILHDDGSWALVEPGAEEQPSTQAGLTLEKKIELARGCKIGLRLQNDLSDQIRSLVLRFTAYKGEQIPFETVSRGFSYIKPTMSQYQEVSFRGIQCDEIVSVEVTAARNCHVGELTKYSAAEEHCLALVDVAPSTILPVLKRVAAE